MTKERFRDLAPGLAKLMDERTGLAKDLYELARKSHAPEKPCDEDIECQDCTLLLIASDELDLPEPWETEAEYAARREPHA